MRSWNHTKPGTALLDLALFGDPLYYYTLWKEWSQSTSRHFARIAIFEAAIWIDFQFYSCFWSVLAWNLSIHPFFSLSSGQHILYISAYMKMIDIWLFTGLFIPFIIFNILVSLDILNFQEKDKKIFVYAWMNDEEKSKSRTLLKVSRIVIPVMTVVFCFIYWLVALTIYYSDQF